MGTPSKEEVEKWTQTFAERKRQKHFAWGTVQPYGEVIGNSMLLTPAFSKLNATQKLQVLATLPGDFMIFTSDWQLLYYYYDFCTGAFNLLTEYSRHQLSYMGRGTPDIVNFPLTAYQQKKVIDRFWSRIGYAQEGEYWISWVPGGGYFEVMQPNASPAALAAFWPVALRGYRYRIIDKSGDLLGEKTLALPADPSPALGRAPGFAGERKRSQLQQWSQQLAQGQRQAVQAQIRQQPALAQAVFAELLFDTVVRHASFKPTDSLPKPLPPNPLLEQLVQTLHQPAVTGAYRHWQAYLAGQGIYDATSQGFDRCVYLFLQTQVYAEALSHFDYPDEALVAKSMRLNGAKTAEAYLQLAQALDLERARGMGLYHKAHFDRLNRQPAETQAWEAYLHWTEHFADAAEQVDALYRLGASYFRHANLLMAHKYYHQGLLKAEAIGSQDLATRYHQEFAAKWRGHFEETSLTELLELLDDETIREDVLYQLAHKSKHGDRVVIPKVAALLDDTRFREYAAMTLQNLLEPQDGWVGPKLAALLSLPGHEPTYAITALAALQDKSYLPLMLPHLAKFPYSVIPAIGDLGDAAMIPLLEPYAAGSDTWLKGMADKAIEKLRGKSPQPTASH